MEEVEEVEEVEEEVEMEAQVEAEAEAKVDEEEVVKEGGKEGGGGREAVVIAPPQRRAVAQVARHVVEAKEAEHSKDGRVHGRADVHGTPWRAHGVAGQAALPRAGQVHGIAGGRRVQQGDHCLEGEASAQAGRLHAGRGARGDEGVGERGATRCRERSRADAYKAGGASGPRKPRRTCRKLLLRGWWSPRLRSYR